MNRREYLTALIAELKSIQEDELQEVLRYYNEYFDEAGEENEQHVIAELGSPDLLAAQIRASAAIKQLEEKNVSSNKSFRHVFIAIGAVFAAPIALPLAIALAAVAFALLIVAFALVVSFYAVVFALAVSGVAALIASIFLLFVEPLAFVYMFGAALVALSLAVLSFLPATAFSKFCFKKIAILMNKRILRRSKNENQE